MTAVTEGGPLTAPKPRPRRRRRYGALLLLAPALLLSLYALILPMLVFLRYSFYRFERGRLIEDWVLDAYVDFFTDPFYLQIGLESLQIALTVTVISVLISYPLAYCLWRLNKPGLQKWLALIIFSPIMVSVVVRSYGWQVVLSDQGVVNQVLLGLGLFAEPARILYTALAVIIGLVHVFLPFAVFPMYSSMTRLDPALREAAYDLGAGWFSFFWRIALPRTLPGVIAGAQVCFTLALGSFVTASLLGGGRVQVFPIEVYRATAEINWPTASVANLVLLVLAIVSVMIFSRLARLAED